MCILYLWCTILIALRLANIYVKYVNIWKTLSEVHGNSFRQNSKRCIIYNNLEYDRAFRKPLNWYPHHSSYRIFVPRSTGYIFNIDLTSTNTASFSLWICSWAVSGTAIGISRMRFKWFQYVDKLQLRDVLKSEEFLRRAGSINPNKIKRNLLKTDFHSCITHTRARTLTHTHKHIVLVSESHILNQPVYFQSNADGIASTSSLVNTHTVDPISVSKTFDCLFSFPCVTFSRHHKAVITRKTSGFKWLFTYTLYPIKKSKVKSYTHTEA